jgi:hypothetical protein
MATTYDKIPGLGSGRGGLQFAVRSRMYRGLDHLLVVQSTGYTEDYRRIFYRDIRYVEVRKSQGQLIHGIISAVLTLLVALTYFMTVPWGLVIVFCFPFVIWFLANIVWGPTVECYVSTNVQTLRIPTPRRRKKVTVLIDFLREQTAAFEPVETTQPA